jgi:hypothetical protein
MKIKRSIFAIGAGGKNSSGESRSDDASGDAACLLRPKTTGR